MRDGMCNAASLRSAVRLPLTFREWTEIELLNGRRKQRIFIFRRPRIDSRGSARQMCRVCPSTAIVSTPTGRILLKFGTGSYGVVILCLHQLPLYCTWPLHRPVPLFPCNEQNIELCTKIKWRVLVSIFSFFLSLSWRNSPLVGLGLLLIHEDFCGFEITHNDTPQSVGLLWTCDQPVAETST